MINNLAEYFLPEHEFYLKNISYERIDKSISKGEHPLKCMDGIVVDLLEGDALRITVTRTLNFEPEEIFSLAVSYGAILKFDPQKKEAYNWQEIDLSKEFKENGDFVTGNLMSRIALMIAQITSSYGQTPLVLPPSVAQKL